MLAPSPSTRKGWRQDSIPALSESRLWVMRLLCFQSVKILCFLGDYNLFIFFLPSIPPPLSPHCSLRGISGFREAQRTRCGSVSRCSGYSVKIIGLHLPILEWEKSLFKTSGTCKHKYLQLTNVANA